MERTGAVTQPKHKAPPMVAGKTVTPPPRSAGRQAGKPKRITPEKVEEMFTAWCAMQSLDHVQRTCGVTWHTAKKYVEIGDPERGLESIRKRHLALMERNRRRHDRTFQQAMEEWTGFLARLKRNLFTVLDGKDVFTPEQLKALKPQQFADLVTVVMRNESFVLGGPDSRSGHVVDWDTCTDEQLKRIADGESPAVVLGK